MKLEQQVVSLELAQKLKELGVMQESFAYFITPKIVELLTEALGGKSDSI